ncbi:MAG TPA: thioesterase domain-containing protein, partial [Thermomicrobiales bacterium]|nr:thioesterase domain-containing protein [Thermomicrobiales bacterium]
GEAFNLVPFAKLFRRVAPERAAWGFIGREHFGGEDDGDAQAWVRDIAAQYIGELRSRQPDGPYVIVGACAGGNIAFEMAQQLHAAGAAVERLILMDVWHAGGRSVRRTRVRLGLGARTRAQRLHERLAIRGLDAADADPASDALRASSRETLERRYWLNQYDPTPYPLPIALLVNEAWHAESATLGWDRVAAGGLEVIVMAGAHDTYLDEHFDDAVVRLRTLFASMAAAKP